MPQNVLVSVLGEGKYLTALVRAILEKNIIPTRFLFLSAKNEASLQAAEGYDVTVCEDELSAVIKSEIVLVTASRREMPTELAKISSSSQKRVVVRPGKRKLSSDEIFLKIPSFLYGLHQIPPPVFPPVPPHLYP